MEEHTSIHTASIDSPIDSEIDSPSIDSDPTLHQINHKLPILSLNHVHFPSHWQLEKLMHLGTFATGILFYDPKYDEYFHFSTRQHRKRLSTFRSDYPLKGKWRNRHSTSELLKHSPFYLAFFFLIGSLLFMVGEICNLKLVNYHTLTIIHGIKGILFLFGAIAGFIEVIDMPNIIQLEKDFKHRIHYYRKLHLPMRMKRQQIMNQSRKCTNFSLHQIAFWSSTYLLSGVILLTSADIGRLISDPQDDIQYSYRFMAFIGSILLFIANILKFMELSHFFRQSFQFQSFGYWAVICFILLSILLIVGIGNGLYGFMSHLNQQIILILSACFGIIGSVDLLMELLFT
eukprot:NODE_614_length_5380_cov_0.964022.p2 type:complete len:345 gc:universal NODE_614_length_5380_cov_0.964022:4050-3016(-)